MSDAFVAVLGNPAAAGQVYNIAGDRLVTFLDNHDLPRVMSACGGAADRVDRALVLLFGLRGTPALSWGTEALVEGAEEPANRVSLPWDRADVRRDALAALQGLRAAHPALDRGQTRILHASEDLLVLGRWTDQDAALIRIHTGMASRLGRPHRPW